MKPQRVLLFYEQEGKSELLRSLLRGQGCEVQEALLLPVTVFPAQGYCLVVFDVHRWTDLLLQSAQAWRDAAPDTMLLVAASRIPKSSRTAMLANGVDGFLNKPLALAEVRACIQAALRRFRSQDGGLRRLTVGEHTIDLETRLVTSPGRKTGLTPTECGILECLAAHANQTVPRTELVKRLWGSDRQKRLHALRLFIRGLRQKLEPDPKKPQYLVSDARFGYCLRTSGENKQDSVKPSGQLRVG
jgi:two-component system, OmpR family, KDP operon response regulator KdpE